MVLNSLIKLRENGSCLITNGEECDRFCLFFSENNFAQVLDIELINRLDVKTILGLNKTNNRIDPLFLCRICNSNRILLHIPAVMLFIEPKRCTRKHIFRRAGDCSITNDSFSSIMFSLQGCLRNLRRKLKSIDNCCKICTGCVEVNEILNCVNCQFTCNTRTDRLNRLCFLCSSNLSLRNVVLLLHASDFFRMELIVCIEYLIDILNSEILCIRLHLLNITLYAMVNHLLQCFEVRSNTVVTSTIRTTLTAQCFLCIQIHDINTKI